MTGSILWWLSALWLMSAVRAEEEVPECVNIPGEKMARMRALVVKEDVHDKLVGDFSELWVSKVILEEGENNCVRYTRTRLDDRVLFHSLETKEERYPTRNSTIEKVGNGIYLVKRRGDEIVAKLHVLYADDRAVAYFGCGLLPMAVEGTEPSVLTRVSVRARDLKTLLEADTQAAVDEAVRRVSDHQDLFGEIVLNPLAC